MKLRFRYPALTARRSAFDGLIGVGPSLGCCHPRAVLGRDTGEQGVTAGQVVEIRRSPAMADAQELRRPGVRRQLLPRFGRP